MKTDTEHAGIRVLVVEDSQTQAEYLRHILEHEGYSVVLATDGNAALDQIRINRPAIVLTDILMPEMDGFALCRTIKKTPGMADLPVILVTQLFDPVDLRKGLEAGADNIIIKPFEAEHVTARITSTLKSRNPAGPPDARSPPEEPGEDRTRQTPAGRVQPPAILLSSYDIVVRKNTELQEAYDHLTARIEDLQQRMERLQATNELLLKENADLKQKK